MEFRIPNSEFTLTHSNPPYFKGFADPFEARQ